MGRFVLFILIVVQLCGKMPAMPKIRSRLRIACHKPPEKILLGVTKQVHVFRTDAYFLGDFEEQFLNRNSNDQLSVVGYISSISMHFVIQFVAACPTGMVSRTLSCKFRPESFCKLHLMHDITCCQILLQSEAQVHL